MAGQPSRHHEATREKWNRFYPAPGKNIEEARKRRPREKGDSPWTFFSTLQREHTSNFQAKREKSGLAPMRIPRTSCPITPTRMISKPCGGTFKNGSRSFDFLAVRSTGASPREERIRSRCTRRSYGPPCNRLGADLYSGPPSHAIQPIEIYKNKPICYGLGNFVFALEEGFRERRCCFSAVSPPQGP